MIARDVVVRAVAMCGIAAVLGAGAQAALAEVELTVVVGADGIRRERVVEMRNGVGQVSERMLTATDATPPGTIDHAAYDFDDDAAYVTARSAAGDARVGLLENSPLPEESMMGVAIRREANAGQLEITLRGGMCAPMAGSSRAEFRLLVYADLAAADAAAAGDPSAESLFDGAVTLDDRVTTRGGFSDEDFIVDTRSDGSLALHTAGSVWLVLAVPDIDAAVVRLVANTGEATAATVPMASPTGSVLLALALLAAVVRALPGDARPRPETSAER